MSERHYGAAGEKAARLRLGTAERTLIRTAAIDLMLHLARTLPAQDRRRRPGDDGGQR